MAVELECIGNQSGAPWHEKNGLLPFRVLDFEHVWSFLVSLCHCVFSFPPLRSRLVGPCVSLLHLPSLGVSRQYSVLVTHPSMHIPTPPIRVYNCPRKPSTCMSHGTAQTAQSSLFLGSSKVHQECEASVDSRPLELWSQGFGTCVHMDFCCWAGAASACYKAEQKNRGREWQHMKSTMTSSKESKIWSKFRHVAL